MLFVFLSFHVVSIYVPQNISSLHSDLTYIFASLNAVIIMGNFNTYQSNCNCWRIWNYDYMIATLLNELYPLTYTHLAIHARDYPYTIAFALFQNIPYPDCIHTTNKLNYDHYQVPLAINLFPSNIPALTPHKHIQWNKFHDYLLLSHPKILMIMNPTFVHLFMKFKMQLLSSFCFTLYALLFYIHNIIKQRNHLCKLWQRLRCHRDCVSRHFKHQYNVISHRVNNLIHPYSNNKCTNYIKSLSAYDSSIWAFRNGKNPWPEVHISPI